MLEEGIYNEVKNDAVLQPKLDDGDGGIHLYPNRVPDEVDVKDTLAITYSEINQNLVFPAARTSVFTFNCIAKSFDAARDLADDLFNTFNGFNKEKLGDDDFWVEYVSFDNRSSAFDEDANVFVFSVDIAFKY